MAPVQWRYSSLCMSEGFDLRKVRLPRIFYSYEFFGGTFDQSGSQPEFRKITLEKQHKKHKGC